MNVIKFDKHSTESLFMAVRTCLDILPMCLGFVLARIVAHSISPKSTRRFLLEFTLIGALTVVIIAFGTIYSIIYTVATGIFLLVFIRRTRCWTEAKQRQLFELGKRPAVLTLIRATAYLGTTIVILAIDFPIVPRFYHKSRRYGASLMDTGIGLFVLTMGMVTKRAVRCNDFRRLAISVSPLILLGLARTIVLAAINYKQDKHEYGVLLNGFFTLGLVKLIGTCIISIANSNVKLFSLSLALLTIHEIILQSGVSNFVMDDYVPRTTFISANREGICSLPGYIALYLFAKSFDNWFRAKPTLSYAEMCRKLRDMLLVSLICWLLVIISAYTIGISRVVCNFGYVTWIFAIVQTLTTMYMLLFEVVLNTALPLSSTAKQLSLVEGGDVHKVELIKSSQNEPETDFPVAPTIAEAINMNGLTFFLVSNVLTGSVNMFLNPNDRSTLETLIILIGYVFISIGSVYVLYRKQIRIA